MFTKDDIENYFTCYRNEQLFLIIFGGLALGTAILFYLRLKTPWYKGFALPLAVFALLLCSAGFSTYTKVHTLRVSAEYNYDMHPELLKTKELPRIRSVRKNLRILIGVNISILIVSLLIFLYFRKKDNDPYYRGTASSLFLMSAISIIMYALIVNSVTKFQRGIEKYTEQIT